MNIQTWISTNKGHSGTVSNMLFACCLENDVPLWNENAVAVERRDGEAVIIGEGTLAALVAGLQTLRPGALERVSISLPDRGAPPFTFEGQGLVALIKDPRRPRAIATKLLAPTVA